MEVEWLWRAHICKVRVQLLEKIFLLFIFFLHTTHRALAIMSVCECDNYIYLQEVQFLFDMCEHLNCGSDFSRQFSDILVPFLHLLPEIHIPYLQLLKVNHVKTLG